MKQHHANQYGKPVRNLPPLTPVVMSKGIKALIIDHYGNQHDPLAGGIDLEQVAPLTADLQARLAQIGERLDVSAAGMGRLPDAARAYARRATHGGHRFTDEDHLRITREIAAYLGSCSLRGPYATWQNPGSLLEVAVELRGKFRVLDGTDYKRATRLVMNMGCQAANIWDFAVYGNLHPRDPVVWDS